MRIPAHRPARDPHGHGGDEWDTWKESGWDDPDQHEAGTWRPPDATYVTGSPWERVQPARPPARPGRDTRRRWRRKITGGILAMMLISALLAQGNGAFGAWSADLLRAVLGPQATAQIEAWYLNLRDAGQQARYHLSGQQGSAPWANATPAAGLQPHGGPHPMSLPAIAPFIQPGLPGEGVWTTAGLPVPAPGQPSLVAKTFLRPDPVRPYALVTVLRFDLRYLTLHMVAGTKQPGGPRHMAGPGVIPQADRQGNQLVGAFNGGFKYSDGHYGMMVNGTVYVPPQPGAATIAVTKQNQVLLGAWGVDPALNASNQNLIAWRQNAALLINHGILNPLTGDGSAWGGTVLNSAYTWRSGIGITASGTLLYAAGDSLSAATLGKSLLAAGAVNAMQIDINPFWVRAFLYQRIGSGGLTITKLHPQMHGTGKEYLQGTSRDFFYLTRT